MLQGQQTQAQTQNLALDNQQKQIDMQDQATMRQAYMDSGGDMTKMQQLMMQRGASPKAIAGVQSQITAMQEQHEKLTEEQNKNLATKAQAIGTASQSLLDLPDEASRAAAWPDTRMQMITQGHANPSEIPAQYPGQQFLMLHRNGALTVQQSLENAAKAATAANDKRKTDIEGEKQANEAPGQIADAAQKVRANDAATLSAASDQAAYDSLRGQLPFDRAKQFPDQFDAGAVRRVGMTAEQQTAADQRAAEIAKLTTPAELANVAADPTQPQERRDAANAALKRLDAYQQAGRTNVNLIAPASSGSGGISGPTGDEFLKTLPSGTAGVVKAIAEGRQPPFTGLAMQRPYGKQVMEAVLQYDPAWTAQRAQLRRAFTTGPDARNIGNLNTAPVHLDQLHEAAKAMDNGSFQPGNDLYNYVATKFGAPAATNHTFILNALAGEAAAALKGNATDPEIAHVLGSLKQGMSPAQAQGVTEAALHVLAAKLNTYNERYHAQGDPNDPWTPVLPSAKAVFDRYGIDPTAAPSAAGAPAVKKNPFRQ